LLFLLYSGWKDYWWLASGLFILAANIIKEVYDRFKYHDLPKDSLKQIGLGLIGTTYTIISYWCLN